MSSDLFQWFAIIITGGISLLLGILSYKKNPQEQRNIDSNTLKSYAEVARLATEGLEKANIHIKELEEASSRLSIEFERRLSFLESGARYRLIANIKIGEFPVIENIILEPIDVSTISVTTVSKTKT